MSVSYLVTVFNKEEFIGGVIDAIFAEHAITGGEIIVYDDASTDRSSQILQERINAHPQQESQARIMRGDKNQGVVFATNSLINAAMQPYTRLVDGDDVLVKGSTAAMLRLLKENNLGFIHGMTTEVGNYDYDLEKQPFDTCFIIANPVRRALRNAIAGASPSLFVTEELRKTAPLPDWKRRTQDFLITLRIANHGTRMGYVKDVVAVGPSDRTGNNLSASLAAMFAEMSRDVAFDGKYLPLVDLRYASRRYAGRTSKYFRRRAHNRLNFGEKFELWRYRNLAWFESRQDCIKRLARTADFLERDRHVMVTGPSGASGDAKQSRRRLPRRWPMLRLTDAIISWTPAPKKKKGVLILRMFGIGDALLFRAVLEKYAEALGIDASDIAILGSIAWAAAGDLFFKTYKIEFIDERRFTRNFFYRLRVMRNLRRCGFKTAICGMRLRYPHVVESLMLASGADELIVAEPRPNEKFDAMFAHYLPRMTRVVPLPEAPQPRGGQGEPLPLRHEIEQQLTFLSNIAGRPISLTALPKITVPQGIAPLVGRNERYAVLNIGASHAPRRWPMAYFYEMARRLREENYSVVFLGGPAEANLQDEIAGFAGRQSLHDAASPTAKNTRILASIGALDLGAATQLIDQAAVIVSNDSGLGHLAIMLNKPSVLIVGGGHFGSFMPHPPALTPPHVRVLYHLMPCYHCNWNCTMMPPGGKTFPCVSEVSIEQAWESLSDVLEIDANELRISHGRTN